MKKIIYEEVRTYGGDILGKNIVGYAQISRPGFSKIRHKKRINKNHNQGTQQLVPDDFRNIGRLYIYISKLVAEGVQEALDAK